MINQENIHQRITPFPVVLPEYGVFIFESYHSPEFQMHRSAHDFYEIGMVLSGKGLLHVEGNQKEEYEIQDDYLFFIPPGLPHTFIDHKRFPLTLQMICFEENIFLENPYLQKIFFTFRDKFKKQPIIRLSKSYSFQKFTQLFKEMIFEQTQKELGFEVNLRNLISSLLIFINRLDHYDDLEFNIKEQAFMDSLNYLHRHFYKSPSINHLSRIAGQSYRGYTGYFKKKMNKTVLEYITELKINYVKKRLLESGNIEFSAYDAGFNDITNFYRVFKKFTGKTPKQYLSADS
jgi:AraC-like DNA-binding protein/mannose-6-phosphate isomerase-like protein (cupin superfamily)